MISKLSTGLTVWCLLAMACSTPRDQPSSAPVVSSPAPSVSSDAAVPPQGGASELPLSEQELERLLDALEEELERPKLESGSSAP